MRILFINLPYHGHIVPTIGLVQELEKRHCEVTYLLPFGWEASLAGTGAIFHGYQNHRQLSEQIKHAYAAADQIADDYDLLIYEQFFFLGKHLAEKHRKPVVRVFTAPAANEQLMKEYLASKGPLSIFRHKWIAKAFTKDIAKGIPLKTETWLDEIVHNPPLLNLVYTLRAYQPYVSEFPEEQFRFLGPSIYDRKEKKTVFIKRLNPVVYISLGTVIKGSAHFFQSCVEAFRGEPFDVVLSVGSEFDSGRLKAVPANIHIFPSVPQMEILKIADVFVTHGGMNSVSEALVSGTPMVVIPFTADQPVNARRVEALGAGKHLPYSAANKESIRGSVMSVLADPGIRSRIAALQEMIRLSPGNSGGAEMIIDYFSSLNRSAALRP